MPGINDTSNGNLFFNKILQKEPVAQIFKKDNMAEAMTGGIPKIKAWGLTNEFMIYMGNTYQSITINDSYLTRPQGGGRTDVRATITPIIQAARFRINKPEYDRLMKLPSAEMFQNVDRLQTDFAAQAGHDIERAIMGKNDGRICRVIPQGTNNSADLKAYCDDGTTLLPADHIAWQHIQANKIYQLIDYTTSAETVGGYVASYSSGAVYFGISSVTPSTGVITCKTATQSPIQGGTATAFTYHATLASNHVYYLADFSPVQIVSSASAAVAIRPDGLLNMVSDAAGYLTTAPNSSSTGASITNTTAGYELWRTIKVAATGQDLSQVLFDQMSGGCTGTPNLIVCDPAVLSQAFKNETSKKYYFEDTHATLGFPVLMYHNGDNTFRVKTSKYLRGTGAVYMIDTNHIKGLGTILQPEFEFNSLMWDPTTAYYWNDMWYAANFYTDMRSAHTYATGLTQAY